MQCDERGRSKQQEAIFPRKLLHWNLRATIHYSTGEKLNSRELITVRHSTNFIPRVNKKGWDLYRTNIRKFDQQLPPTLKCLISQIHYTNLTFPSSKPMHSTLEPICSHLITIKNSQSELSQRITAETDLWTRIAIDLLPHDPFRSIFYKRNGLNSIIEKTTARSRSEIEISTADLCPYCSNSGLASSWISWRLKATVTWGKGRRGRWIYEFSYFALSVFFCRRSHSVISVFAWGHWSKFC